RRAERPTANAPAQLPASCRETAASGAHRRRLRTERVQQLGGALRHLGGAELHGARTPVLALAQLSPPSVDQRQPERGASMPGLRRPSPPQGGLRLAALPSQQQPEVEGPVRAARLSTGAVP